MTGCNAKDKTPRFRCTQLLSEILRHVPSLEDDLFASLRNMLLERATDKEWTIRVVACHGLGVLARAEGAEEDGDGEETASTVLRTLCQYDLHPNVRIAALPGLALPLNVDTLPFLLSRTRDVDGAVRKATFRILRQVPVRGLSVSQRSIVVRNGLGDREATVRGEVGKLIYNWAISCSNYAGERGDEGRGKPKASLKIDLDEFLDLFDLWDGTVAEEALKALVHKRPDILDGLDLSKGASSPIPTKIRINGDRQRSIGPTLHPPKRYSLGYSRSWCRPRRLHLRSMQSNQVRPMTASRLLERTQKPAHLTILIPSPRYPWISTNISIFSLY